MLTKETMLNAFNRVNEKLKKRGAKGEVLLCGGAVMCLVFNARASTKDVDGIFEPTSIMRDIAKEISSELNLPSDWLNDGAKAFFSNLIEKQEVLMLSNLSVWAPTAEYMLAMKCISARYDTSDKDDVLFLINYLELKAVEQVFQIIEKFYPDNVVPPKTQFLLEELLGG